MWNNNTSFEKIYRFEDSDGFVQEGDTSTKKLFLLPLTKVYVPCKSSTEKGISGIGKPLGECLLPESLEALTNKMCCKLEKCFEQCNMVFFRMTRKRVLQASRCERRHKLLSVTGSNG